VAKLLIKDNVFCKQQTKTFWFRNEDVNTRFSHVAASTRRKTNMIEHVEDENGFVCRSKDKEEHFVLAKTGWLVSLLDVDLGEALGLLFALRWVHNLQLVDMEFEMDFKTVVDNIYGSKNCASNFIAIINDCR